MLDAERWVRGGAALCAVFVLPPSRPDADIAIIVLEQGGFTAMSGSNTICTVTALLEEGVLPIADGPITTVAIETAVGLVSAEAHVREGKVESVSVHNVPSFAVEIGRDPCRAGDRCSCRRRRLRRPILRICRPGAARPGARAEWRLDPTDPFPSGFTVADVWSPTG